MTSLSIFPAPEFGKFEFAGARGHLCRGRSRQPVREFDLRLGRGPGRAEFRKGRAQHGSADRASRRAVEPVVVAAFRLDIRNFDFESLNTGTGVPSMTASIINRILIAIPPDVLRKKMDAMLHDHFSYIEILENEIATLIQERDTLLPLLMNGQVEIK